MARQCCLQRGELVLQPQARGHQDLVVAAAPGVHAATGIAEALGEPRLDRGMAVLVALVEHEAAGAEVLRQRVQLALERRGFVRADHTDVGQPFHMRLAGGDVVQEELAIQQHVVAGEELHDRRVDLDVGFLPERLGHGQGSNGVWRMGSRCAVFEVSG